MSAHIEDYQHCNSENLQMFWVQAGLRFQWQWRIVYTCVRQLLTRKQNQRIVFGRKVPLTFACSPFCLSTMAFLAFKGHQEFFSIIPHHQEQSFGVRAITTNAARMTGDRERQNLLFVASLYMIHMMYHQRALVHEARRCDKLACLEQIRYLWYVIIRKSCCLAK